MVLFTFCPSSSSWKQLSTSSNWTWSRFFAASKHLSCAETNSKLRSTIFHKEFASSTSKPRTWSSKTQTFISTFRRTKLRCGLARFRTRCLWFPWVKALKRKFGKGQRRLACGHLWWRWWKEFSDRKRSPWKFGITNFRWTKLGSESTEFRFHFCKLIAKWSFSKNLVHLKRKLKTEMLPKPRLTKKDFKWRENSAAVLCSKFKSSSLKWASAF